MVKETPAFRAKNRLKTQHYEDPNFNIAFLILIVCFVIQTLIVTGSLNVCLSTLEKLYHYNSFHVAFIDIFYNFGFAVGACILGSIMIDRKMRWLCVGMLLICFGCILFILPVFMVRQSGKNRLNISYVCNTAPKTYRVECSYGSYMYLMIMCAAYFAIGTGSAPLHTLAVNFIHENTSPQRAGLYVGIYYACSSLGPLFGFTFFSIVIKIPLMITQSQNSMASPKDENWIGAFWIVYVIGGILCLTVSVPMLFYPERSKILPSVGASNPSSHERGILSILRKIVSNKEFVLMTMARMSDSLISHTIGVFFVKYVEAKFHLTGGKLVTYSGIILVLGATSGFLLGGVSIKVLKLSGNKLIKNITIMSALGIVAILFLFIRCPNNPIRGVINENNKLQFVSNLSHECHCRTTQFLAICADNHSSYFSPCSVGCKNEIKINGSQIFTNCSSKYASKGSVTHGRCSIPCNLFKVFMITGFLCLVIQFSTYTPQITHSMMVLEEETAQLGLSFQQMLVRTSLMVGPLYQGKFFDMSCAIFSPEMSCKKSRNCIDYNITKLSLAIALPAIILKSLATICLFSATILYTPREAPAKGSFISMSHLSTKFI